MNTIRFGDLNRQHHRLKGELQRAFLQVLSGGTFILGGSVDAFEKEFARYLCVQHAVGLASGTDALSLALLALGVQPGDEVVLPANSYPTVFGVTAIGAVPRLVDIDPEMYTMDPEKLSAVITKKTKAIIPVHLYGQPADMECIMRIARQENIPVVEDCAQAAGATLSVATPALSAGAGKTTWKKAGTLGDVGCFSFYPTKNLGCLGDGGMVVTDNPEIAGRIRRLRMYGESGRYNSIELGRNSRLDELQAAFLLVKLKYLDQWNKQRREIARLYRDKFPISNFKPTTNNQQQFTVQLPSEASYAKHVYHLYVIRSKQRDQVKQYLEEQGVGTAIHYPTPVHCVPSMRYLGYKKGDFPECERACEEILSIPLYPELTDGEVQRVADAVRNFNTLYHESKRQQE